MIEVVLFLLCLFSLGYLLRKAINNTKRIQQEIESIKKEKDKFDHRIDELPFDRDFIIYDYFLEQMSILDEQPQKTTEVFNKDKFYNIISYRDKIGEAVLSDVYPEEIEPMALSYQDSRKPTVH